MRGKIGDGPRTPRDHQHWEAVEEASELLVEQQFQEALQELKRVIEADPNNPYAYQLLGSVLWELQQLEPARDAFKAASLLAPDFLGARVGLSHALRKLGDVGGAEREARIALSRFPGDGEALHALGMAQAARGQRSGAKKSFEAYLATKPELESATEVRSVLEMLNLGEEGEPFELDEEDD
jgi:Flp pilus assembly protein TadD